MKDFLDRAALSIAVLTPLAIMFSVIHSWAYWTIIDPAMFRTMGIADHIISVISSLPAFMIVMAGYALLIGLFWSLKPSINLGIGTVPDRIIASGAGRTIAAFIVAGILVAAMLLVPDVRFKMILAFGALSSVALPIFFKVGVLSVSKPTQAGAIVVVCIGVLLTVFAVLFGAILAVSDLMQDKPDHRIELSSGDTLENVQVLRSSQNGVYVRDLGAKSQHLIMWSEIASITELRSPVPTAQQAVCRLSLTC